MHLTIGDIVRDRGDRTLGTVAGFAVHPDGPLVAVRVADDLHLSEPGDLDLVGRAAAPAIAGDRALTVFGRGVATLLGYVAVHSAHDLGADWVLSLLAGVGAYAAVTAAVRCALRLIRPRRLPI
jgi:hypothetical protein